MLKDIAIVGYGDSYLTREEAKSGKVKTPLQLAVESTSNALHDANLTTDDIDGLLTGRAPFGDRRWQWNQIIAQELKLATKFSTEVTLHATGNLIMLAYAAMAISSGYVNYVVCVNADNQAVPSRQSQEANAVSESDVWFEMPYGTYAAVMYALVCERYKYEHNISPAQAALAAVNMRKWAINHPIAAMKDKGPITVEDVLKSRVICTPLHLLDCSVYGQPPGAGGAVILTTVERAKKLTDRYIHLLGFGGLNTHEYICAKIDSKTHQGRNIWSTLASTGAKEASEDAYAMAGLSPKDMGIVSISDQFTYIAMMNLEGCGFCKLGEAGRFLEKGGIDYDAGGIPVNTNGGYLSFGQLNQVAEVTRLIEVVRQMRGEPLGKKVDTPRYGLIQAHGGVESCNGVVILGNEVPKK